MKESKATRRMIHKQSLSLFALALLLPQISFGQIQSNKNTTTLTDVVVSADKQATPRSTTAANVSVVTREEIAEQQAISVPEALRNIPGLNVTAVGAPGDDVDIRMRGSDRDEVLIMIDGVVLNSPIDRRANFLGTIPIDNIERIEIVRGSQSILYGSDAIGGVINIITRKGSPEPNYFVRFEAGNLQRFRESAGLSGGTEKIQYSATFSRLDQGGRFDRDRFGEFAGSANFGIELSPEAKVSVGANYINSSQELFYEFLAGFDPVAGNLIVRVDPDNNRKFNQDVLTAYFKADTAPLPWWNIIFQYSFLGDWGDLSNSAAGDVVPAGFTAGMQNFSGDGTSHTIDIQNIFSLYESDPLSADLTVGFEFNDERFSFTDPPAVFPAPGQQSDRQNYAPYFQGRLHLLNGDLVLSAGTRYDHNTSFGKEWSPRASVVYDLKKTGTTFRFSYGEGFHAPTILDFFTQTLLQATGSPAFQAVLLQEELSQSYEFGVEQQFGKWANAAITIFYIDYDRLFDELQFIPDAHSTGVELSLTVTPHERVSFGGNYTLLDAINDGTQTQLANRPKHQVNAFVTAQPIKRLRLRADLNYVSSRLIPNTISTAAVDIPVVFLDANGNTRTTLNDYVTVDLSGTVDILENVGIFKKWQAFVKVNNLFDKQYQEKFGFPAPGINFLAGSQATF